jgi:peroxiredoxin
MRTLTHLVILAGALAMAGACSKDEGKKTEATKTAEPPKTEKQAEPPKTAELLTSPVLGKPAPDFTLKDLDGKDVTLSSLEGTTVVLEWFNPECPFVKKAHSKGSLVNQANQTIDNTTKWIAINSGGPGKQGHDPAVNVEAVKTWGLTHPVLRDETGEIGKAYGATNTPHMFVIDPNGIVVYAGAIDNSPDGELQSAPDGNVINYVAAALEDLRQGRPVATPLTKAYGCGVKYGS